MFRSQIRSQGACRVLLRAAETLASRLGAQLRLVSFAVQFSPLETARLRVEGAAVIDEWTATIRSAAREALQAEHEPASRRLNLMSSSGTARTGRRPSNPTRNLVQREPRGAQTSVDENDLYGVSMDKGPL